MSVLNLKRKHEGLANYLQPIGAPGGVSVTSLQPRQPVAPYWFHLAPHMVAIRFGGHMLCPRPGLKPWVGSGLARPNKPICE